MLAHLEQTLAKAYRIKGDAGRSLRFARLAARRETAIRRLMWDERAGMFTDYAWQKRQASVQITAAGLFPLFVHIATSHQAEIVSQTVRRELLMPGGIATTLVPSGQQWDQPNGWAPFQWIAVAGFNNYHEAYSAEVIAKRWTCENIEGYHSSGTLVEKYNLIQGGSGGGGEYALQVGFGWTNGVLHALSAIYPQLSSLSTQLCKDSDRERQ